MKHVARTRVKICGITTLDEAVAAARAGADAVGIILYAPGDARQIDADSARKLAMALPPFVLAVGVVVDCPSNRVRQLLAHIPLSAVQFNGKESAQDVRSCQPTPAIKRLPVGAELATQATIWASAIVPNLAGVMVEVSADDGVASSFVQALDRAALPPLVVSGDLHPESATEVVRRLRPWALDVSAGVENDDGHKSPRLMAEFIAAVRAADRALAAE